MGAQETQQWVFGWHPATGTVEVMDQLPAVIADPNLRVSLLTGDATHAWLDDAANVTLWRSLYASCPWGTPFQTPDFFRIWFRHTGERWRAILALGFDDRERLRGLFPLAAADGLVTGVGAHQAEYHGFIGGSDCSPHFLSQAVDAILAAFPRHDLQLRYLPAGVPKMMIETLLCGDRRSISVWKARPLLALDEASIGDTLKKKSNRSKINRLKRLGALSIRKLGDGEFARVIDEISAMCDFRQGAVNDSCPFLDDPHKRPFHLDWLRSMPGEVHTSGMFVDDKLISILIFALSKDEAHIAITAHSPEHAEHSPGKIHIYEAGLILAREGFKIIDLTPGGDAWKSRFATHFDEVADLKVYANARKAFFFRARATAARIARSALGAIKPRPAPEKGDMPEADPIDFISYTPGPGPVPPTPSVGLVRVNALAELLRFGPRVTRTSRQVFLSRALSRMESGARCYALCEPDGIAAIGWLAGAERRIELSDFSAVTGADVQAAYGKIIRRMLADLGDGAEAHMSVQAGDLDLIESVERSGFQRDRL